MNMPPLSTQSNLYVNYIMLISRRNAFLLLFSSGVCIMVTRRTLFGAAAALICRSHPEGDAMNSVLSLMLAILTLIQAAFTAVGTVRPPQPGIVPDPDISENVPVMATTAPEVPFLEAPPATETDYRDMEYVHYDTAYFSALAEQMLQKADEEDADAVCDLYDQLYQEYLKVDSLTTLTMLRHDADFYDEYWSEEYNYMYSTWYEVRNTFFSACSEVLSSRVNRAFSLHVGLDTAFLLRDYSELTEEEMDNSQELELLDKYYALSDTMDGISYSYQGEDWDLERLYGFGGSALAYESYDAYLEVYNGIQKAISDVFAPLYIQLVELWTQEARDNGYDSYTDYAYEVIYWRDYTPEDAQRFCDAVKPIAREYYADLYYSDLGYETNQVSPVFTPEALLDILGIYLPRIAPALVEPWEQMTEHGLYDLQSGAAGRYDGAYTTNLNYWHSPFLFGSLTGDCYDLITVTHEFGHFCDYWFSPQTNIITQADNLDLSEIHSNALQALFTAFYGEIYSEGADIAEFINLSNLLENIIEGCLYDEFQRRILDDPEDLTPEKINAIHTQLCMEYGMYDDREWDSSWAYIAHNFERPLYYISYAASGMAALQIWDMAQTDFDGAVAVYLNVLSHGSYADDYGEVLEECGLRLFSEEGAVEEVCRPVLDALEALDKAAR